MLLSFLIVCIVCMGMIGAVTASIPAKDKIKISDPNDAHVIILLDLVEDTYSPEYREKVAYLLGTTTPASQYAVFGGEAWPIPNLGSMKPNVTDNGKIISIHESKGCMAYSSYCTVILSNGATTKGTKITDPILDENVKTKSLTTEEVKAFMHKNAQIGAHIRFQGNENHSMTYLVDSIDGEGFYFLESYGTDGQVPLLHYVTYEKITNHCNNKKTMFFVMNSYIAPVSEGDNPVVTPKIRDSVLVLDVSGSMNGEPLTEMKNAATKFVETVLEKNDKNRVAIVTYSSSAKCICELTSDLDALKENISSLSASGVTNISGGLSLADTLFRAEAESTIRNIVLMTDGLPNRGYLYDGKYTSADHGDYAYANHVYRTAKSLTSGSNLYTLGFFQDISWENGKEFAARLMKDIATKEENYHEITDITDFEFVFGDVAEEITKIQKKTLIHIACPVDATISLGDKKLSSSEGLTTAPFGTLTMTGTDNDRELSFDLEYNENYVLEITGNDAGTADLTIRFTQDGEELHTLTYEGITVSDGSRITTSWLETTSDITVFIDDDGDGTPDSAMEAGKNSPVGVVDNGVLAEPSSDELTITGDSDEGITIYYGESYKFKGTATGTDSVYLFLTGDALNEPNGILLPVKADGGAFMPAAEAAAPTAPVTNEMWEYIWDTSRCALPVDTTYTLYATSKLTNGIADTASGEAVPLSEAVSTSIALRLSHPFLSAIPSGTAIANGDSFYIRGTLAGQKGPAKLYLFGEDGYFSHDLMNIYDDGTYEYVLDTELTPLPLGEYSILIEYSWDSDSLVITELDDNGVISLTDGSETLIVAGSDQKAGAEEAKTWLGNIIDGHDDTELWTQFSAIIVEPALTITPMPDTPVNSVQKLTLSGTTNLAVGDQLTVTVFLNEVQKFRETTFVEYDFSSGNSWQTEVDDVDKWAAGTYTILVEHKELEWDTKFVLMGSSPSEMVMTDNGGADNGAELLAQAGAGTKHVVTAPAASAENPTDKSISDVPVPPTNSGITTEPTTTVPETNATITENPPATTSAPVPILGILAGLSAGVIFGRRWL